LTPKFHVGAVIYGASVFLAYGFIAIFLGSLLSASISQTFDLYVRFWGESILAILMGFFLILAGWLIGSRNTASVRIGGLVGTLASIIGTFDSLVLLNTATSISYSPVYNANLIVSDLPSLVFVMLFIGTMILLFVGFPLGMVGSFGALTREEGEEGSSIPAESS
jgi:hypothetical protein